MKIGYLLVCHKAPVLVAKIAKRLTKNNDNMVFVCVDKKTDIEEYFHYLPESSQIRYVTNRVKIFWGGYSMVEAVIHTLKTALQYPCDRYMLLQGADYPIVSNEKIEHFFMQYPNVEFVKGKNVSKAKNRQDYMRCCGYYMFDLNRRKLTLKSMLAHGFSLFNRLGIKYRRGYVYDRKQKKRYDVYWGWAQFAITRRCAEYIIDWHDTHPKFNQYFRHCFAPDELYFCTVVWNSPFKEYTNQTIGEGDFNLTYFEYGDAIRIFREWKEIAHIDRERYLFVRKVAPECEIVDRDAS